MTFYIFIKKSSLLEMHTSHIFINTWFNDFTVMYKF